MIVKQTIGLMLVLSLTLSACGIDRQSGSLVSGIQGNSDAAYEQPAAHDLIGNPDSSDEDILYYVDEIKRIAQIAIRSQNYSYRMESVELVGKELQNLLTYDFADRINSDTFQDNGFSVTITTYPLKRGHALQTIRYEIKNNDAQPPIEESRYFLRYVGDTSQFSTIERGDPGEQFYVFENSDGCFAFSVWPGDEKKTYSTTNTFSEYYAEVFSLIDDGFSIKRILLPLLVDSSNILQLRQSGETIIAGLAYGYPIQNQPEVVFDSASIEFKAPDGIELSETVDYAMPGLLLGLSDSEGNIRTLFIRKEGDRIQADTYLGQIIFPRKGELFSLEHFVLEEEYVDEDGAERPYPAGETDIRKLVCVPLGSDVPADYIDEIDGEWWSYRESTDIPLYVGEDYVCYIQQARFSGGGSFRVSPSIIRFDRIDNLPRYALADTLIPDFPESTLADLLYGEKAKEYYQSDNTTYGGSTRPYIDFKQLSILRNLGKWSLMLPVMQEYYHPGNGSYSSWIDSFAVYSNRVPDFLASHEEPLALTGGWDDWYAKDLFRFPGSDAILVLHDYIIGVRGQKKDSYAYDRESNDLEIPVSFDEYIVSLYFADGLELEHWKDALASIDR